MNDKMYHHGILGQKWGVRRFQNSDGSLTAAGKRRYYDPREDEQEYKYNKAGESGWAGLRRKLQARKEQIRKKKQAYLEEMERYGREEDAQEYEYNKSGESGWKGLLSKIKNNKNETIGKNSVNESLKKNRNIETVKHEK